VSGEAFALVGETVLPGGFLRRAAVVIEGGGIPQVIEDPLRGDLPRGRREVSGVVCPGFVELQINGAFGIDVDADPEALEALTRELPRTGTTSFLPTLISSPAERYAGFLEALEEASRRPSGACILGTHLARARAQGRPRPQETMRSLPATRRRA